MKKFLLPIILIFFYGCGYSSLYEDQKNDLLINVKNMKGDFEINNFIKNELKIASNRNSINIYDLNFETKYEKIILTKDATGKATDYRLKMNVTFIIISNQNQTVTYKEEFLIKNESDNFEQSNYEKEIKKNFSKTVKDKLVLMLINR
mgnify:CR=1 FL=1|tara:strand:- start:143 stop:586 length:444 start_codon:yes stop_codon:yes gene_type:complete